MFWKKLPWNQTDEEFIAQVRKNVAWRNRWGFWVHVANAVLACVFVGFFIAFLNFVVQLADGNGVVAYFAAAFVGVAFAWQMSRVLMALVVSAIGRRTEKLLCDTFNELPPDEVEPATAEFVEETQTQLAIFQRQRISLFVASCIAVLGFFLLLFMVESFLQIAFNANGPPWMPLPLSSLILGALFGSFVSWKATITLLGFHQVATVPRAERVLIELCDKRDASS